MRREDTVTIADENSRDHGRKYLITEMPAIQAEAWAYRVLNGMLIARVDLGAVTPLMGMAGLSQALANLGVLAIEAIGRMPWELQKPLLDEMLTSVQYVAPSPRPLNHAMDDINEVSTLVLLRERWLSLHLGFSFRERLSKVLQQLREAAVQNSTGSNTRTSPTPSDG